MRLHPMFVGVTPLRYAHTEREESTQSEEVRGALNEAKISIFVMSPIGRYILMLPKY